jgi:hypothetical protein
MDVNALTIGGVSLLVLIQITVGLAKKLGFPTGYCPHLAAGLGIAGGIGIAIIGGQPIYLGIIGGLITSAIACGVYDGSQGQKTSES